MMNTLKAILFILTIFTAAFAAPGDLDQSFGTGGKVITKFAQQTSTRLATPEAVTIQPDGKIIAGGMARDLINGGFRVGVALVRYNLDGSLDTTFDVDGKFHMRINGYDSIHALAVQPDGKIIAGGITDLAVSGNNNFACVLMRLNPNGSLDTTFNGTGYRIDDWTTGLDETVTVAIQPDGKIIAGGFLNAGYFADFAMARYHPNGSLDTSFGNGGLVRTDFEGNTSDGAQGIVLLPNGKIILGGAVSNADLSTEDYALIGYNNDGSIDTSFGTGGKVRTIFSGEDAGGADLELTPDNKLIMVGGVGQPGVWKVGAARYNLDGSLDPTFGSGGLLQIDFPGDIESANAVKPLANGQYIVAGDGEPVWTEDFYVMRLNNNGSIDTSFGNGGSTFVDFGSFRPSGGFTDDSMTDMEIAPDGKIVVVGDIEIDPNLTHDFGVARFENDAPVSTTRRAFSDFDGDGKTDAAVFRPSSGAWYINNSQDGFSAATFGQNGDQIAPADYDGDGKTDIAVFRTGAWYRINSSNAQFVGTTFGQAGDIALPADFDGDNKADINVFRPSNGGWYRLNSTTGAFVGTAFGTNGDKPLNADFDGDGKADIAVFRPSAGAFYWLASSNAQFNAASFGLSTDVPVPADYDGDGKTDIAVFRPSNGGWYRTNSSNGGFAAQVFGQSGDVPVAGDYDGDGKADIAVFRNGAWFRLNSSNAQFVGQNFGVGTDKPVPAWSHQ